MKKYFILSLIFLMLFSMPVHAATTDSVATSEDAEQSVYVDVSKGSSFTVILPKTINIDPSIGSGSYTVAVTGDMNPNQIVSIVCADEIELTDTSGAPTTVLFNVSNNKTIWTWEDIYGGITCESREVVELKQGEELPAGSFTGKLRFNINCQTDTVNGIFTQDDIDFLGLENATVLNIPASIDYGNGVIKQVTTIQECLLQDNTTVQQVNIAEGIQSISPYAFNNCTSLTTVSLPSTMSEIGEGVFENCTSLDGTLTITSNINKIEDYAFKNTGLDAVVIEDGSNEPLKIQNKAFEDNSTIATLTLPSTREVYLYSESFADCDNITELDIPGNVKLNTGVFRDCNILETVSIVGNEDNTLGNEFINCPNLETVSLSNVEEIGNFMFADCWNLKTVTVDNELNRINKYAFAGCSNLESLPIAENVNFIGELAFYKCASAEGDYVWPSSISVVEDGVFSGCSSIDSITFNSVVTEVGDEAFANCGWTSATMLDGLTIIGEKAFYYSGDYAGTNKLTSISLPNSVSSVGEEAFRRCDITEFTIPTSLTVLPAYMLSSCDYLATINTHDGITEFGPYAFKDAIITDLDIPAGVTIIPEGCFQNCDSLTTFELPDTVLEIQTMAFASCSNLTSLSVKTGTTIADTACEDRCNITYR